MPTFWDLPFELRSLVLKYWLDDTVSRLRAAGAFICDSDQYVRGTHPDIHRRMEVVTSIRRCRTDEALKLRKSLLMFSVVDRLEMKRLLKGHLVRLEEEEWMCCAQVEALRQDVLAMYWANRFPRHDIEGIWEEWLNDINALEWLCNTIQLAIGIDAEIWTTFKTYGLGCVRDGQRSVHAACGSELEDRVVEMAFRQSWVMKQQS